MELRTDTALHILPKGYQPLLDHNPLPVIVYNVRTLGVLSANPAAQQRYGYSAQAFAGLSLMDLFTGASTASLQKHLRLPLTQWAQKKRWKHQGRDGRVFDVEIDADDLDMEGQPTRMVLVRELTPLRLAEQAQLEAAERLTSTLESMTDAFVLLDQNACFSYLNRCAEELIQSPRSVLIGRNLWDTFPALMGGVFQQSYEQVATSGKSVSMGFHYPPADLWLDVQAYSTSAGIAVYFRDVTERHTVQTDRQREREVLNAIMRASSDAIVSIDSKGRITTFSPGAEAIFGLRREDIEGKNVELLLPQRYQTQLAQRRIAYAQYQGEPCKVGRLLIKGLRADGEEIDLEGHVSRTGTGDQQVLIATLQDITVRMRAKERRRVERIQMSQLVNRLMTQEQDLVSRIAQAMHDQLGQTLAAIRMAHDTMGVLRAGTDSTELASMDQRLGTLIQQGIRQVRQVLVELRPPLLDENGLAAALDNELRNRRLVQSNTQVSLQLKSGVDGLRWPAAVEYAAFMIAREALDNALRHAHAATVSVLLSGTVHGLRMEIVDDGSGFAAWPIAPGGHLGLAGMRERAHAVGAELEVLPGEGRGTRVDLRWQAAS